MGGRLRLGIAAAALLGLGGCAGMPAAVTVASFAMDGLLYIGTSKSSTDHIVSAMLQQDCAAFRILTEGSFCKPLIVPVTRIAEAAPEPVPEPPPPPPPAPPIPLPVTADVDIAAMPSAPRPAERRFLVVAGSFAKRGQAEARRDRLGHPEAGIVVADVRGRRVHRVVLPPEDRPAALRRLAEIRAAGVGDAWLLPWNGRPDDMTYAGLPDRM